MRDHVVELALVIAVGVVWPRLPYRFADATAAQRARSIARRTAFIFLWRFVAQPRLDRFGTRMAATEADLTRELGRRPSGDELWAGYRARRSSTA